MGEGTREDGEGERESERKATIDRIGGYGESIGGAEW